MHLNAPESGVLEPLVAEAGAQHPFPSRLAGIIDSRLVAVGRALAQGFILLSLGDDRTDGARYNSGPAFTDRVAQLWNQVVFAALAVNGLGRDVTAGQERG